MAAALVLCRRRDAHGDWEAYPLTAEQRDYAALDAYASFRSFELAGRASPTARAT